MTPIPFADYVQQQAAVITPLLQQYLPPPLVGAERLHAAMAYSLLQGGKRVRPLLAFASAEALGAVTATTGCVAFALEAIHAYSLVHDDLPAMDDDDLRRGQPTCHRAFDEATAILAGDALQSMAFEALASVQTTAPQRVLALMAELGRAAGAQGMVAGQAMDLAAVNCAISLEQLETMHRHKTGALIEAAVVMGAISSERATPEQLQALRRYARALGLAFQVQDDILDVTTDTATLGKQQGADQHRNKPTYVSLLGLTAAQALAQQLYREALDALSSFDENALRLRQLAAFVVQRGY